ncbi:uncharacterized protein LOC113515705 isoform X2 [Galleria mellonella]|uniref:Uncharacterized protein LOC113515705 isoform X2 n=1 Tax=Galleria mellonella TaxID=7137 RepID=A0A6J3C838_GALME|nr:uncharacterized protein LOC113515705 isoform X2 [Galleria mellonella]XP_031768564.2 uncharacterized protein LOC113515705 isoform X2 [Galleria mellonella]XP_031768566.2 uncharacterized protein LOC113515705 isoform X2 [Galleria mellonella]XP_031768571.2 uncharacterized protein LOC113515705 isoform X2 [Galleria mellonella]XP_031768578.2 uncharacterized protein LOC113515705 isoform X2 [Galleria mellonella]XP_031768581.2 uncharacterized protein LOC113515705 isoform X2 [Galleria mellonella]
MIKFRYKRKESNDGAGTKNGAAIQKKIEGLWDRELLPPKDLLTNSVAGVRNNTLPRSRPPSAQPWRETVEQTPLVSQTTLTLFRELFTQLQWSAERAPAADALRRALGGGGARFQLGCMADASECFEHLLLRVHAHVATTAADRRDDDSCRAAHCVPHRKFAMMLIEQSVCGSCNATSKPLRFTQMVHYVSATALTAQAALGEHGDSFGLLLKQAGGMGDIRDCPNACGAKIQICRTLNNRPEILSIGMVWDSERPSAEHVAAVYAALGTELRPADAFHTCADWAWAARATHRLVGLVTYYGKHYSTFFFHSKLRLWIYFDDADVKEVGPEWSQVVEKCCKGRFQPLLLLYAAVDGTPCDTRHAPKDVVPFPAPEPRRAITPAPDRQISLARIYGRRAVTPGPDNENDYISRKSVENMLECNRHSQLGRSMSTGSGSDSSGPRVRRDSGNWSGDRNSASSASSSMESPYIYTRGRGPGSVPSSPTRKGELSSGGSCDAGYDSYSLSSTDSLPLQQGIRNMQLAQVPDIKTRGNCEALCLEADRLLEKSRHAEDAADYETAVVLCDAATSKARAAMEAPYNNPHTMIVARMKHNTCVMRSRSLQRRMTGKSWGTEIPQIAPVRNTKGGLENANIEIYATLPKKKSSSKKSQKSIEDDINNPPCERPPRHKSREDEKTREKRSRSEDRGRVRKEIPVTTEKKDEIVTEDKKASKKQHKIRRKLLMGGLIRRKNRSMPDLTEGADGNNESANKEKRISSVDDGEVGRRKSEDKVNLSGYLSEGHLEYSTASGTNPNLERSKLMRKSIHGSVGKILTAPKVPPPPPLRTTSQLSGSKFDTEVMEHGTQCRSQQPVSRNDFSYSQQDNEEDGGFSEQYGDEPQSLPFLPSSYDGQHGNSYRIDDSPSQNFQMIVTKAMIHQEQSPVKRETMPTIQPSQNNIQNLSTAFNQGVDVVDSALPLRRSSPQIFELPPYPSPMNSVNHSRQPSEEFPPPPPPIDLTPLEEELNNIQNRNEYNAINNTVNDTQIPKGSLLAQLREKRNQILRNAEVTSKTNKTDTINTVCDSWLQELQSKQAAIKLKRSNSLEGQLSGPNEISQQTLENSNIVKQNTQMFENIGRNITPDAERSHIGFVDMRANRDVINCANQSSTCMYNRRTSSSSIDPNQLQDEYNDQQQSINTAISSTYGDNLKPKKKSVSFCDHVVIVSSKAEEEEDNNYIPNPILERVLKSAMNKRQMTTMPLQSEKSTLQRQDSFDSQSSRSTTLSTSQNTFVQGDNDHADYLRLQDTYPSYQPAPQPHQQPLGAPKNAGMYERLSPPTLPSHNLNATNANPVPTGVPKNSTASIPYNQPPSAYSNHNLTPPIYSLTSLNRLTPTGHSSYMPAHLLRPVPNTYPHPPNQTHQATQAQNSINYQRDTRLPQHSPPSALPSNNYNINRQANQNIQSNTSPYQSVPTNSPAYQSYHTPPTSYSSSEYSSRYPVNSTNHYGAAMLYQRVPPPHGEAPIDNYNSNCQKSPNSSYHDNNSNQPLAHDVRHYANSQQQRTMYNQHFNTENITNNDNQYIQQQQQNIYNLYEQTPQLKPLQKKSVSFEPGTKGGTDSPIPPQMNGNNNYYNGEIQKNTALGQKSLCNLCRKKIVSSPSLYCPDCDFYMSRFKPRS